MCLNINMNTRDLLTYTSMVPMIAGILGIIVFLTLLGATGVAAIVIGVGEWLAQN